MSRTERPRPGPHARTTLPRTRDSGTLRAIPRAASPPEPGRALSASTCAVLGLPLTASLLLTFQAYLHPECPWPQLSGASPLGPIGWTISVLTALLYALPGTPSKPVYAWGAVTGVLLSSVGNLHTLQPYTCAYLALMVLYAHFGQAGLNGGLTTVYLLAGSGKLNPNFAATVPVFFANAWSHTPFHGALWGSVYLAVLASPLLELTMAALLTLKPRLVGTLMVAVHAGIIICLARLNWGHAVWIWNLQLLLLGALSLCARTRPQTKHGSGTGLSLSPGTRPGLLGFAAAVLLGLPYALGSTDLPLALPLYTGNTNRLTLTLPGGGTKDAASAAVRRTAMDLNTSPAGLLDYGACQVRLGNAVRAHLNRRWTLNTDRH